MIIFTLIKTQITLTYNAAKEHEKKTQKLLMYYSQINVSLHNEV